MTTAGVQLPQAHAPCRRPMPADAAPTQPHQQAQAVGWQREWQHAAVASQVVRAGVYGGCGPGSPLHLRRGEAVMADGSWALLAVRRAPVQPAQSPAAALRTFRAQQGARAEEAAAAVRLHADWTAEGVSLWLALDRRLAPHAREIAARLRSWMATQGITVQSMTCNGRPLADAGATNHTEEENRWPSME